MVFASRLCDAIFTGRSSVKYKMSGHGEISLYELTENSKNYKGTLALNCWNDLWVFIYSIFSPARHDAASAIVMPASIQKQSATAKAHVLAGHASGRRVHGWKMEEGKGNEVLADLHCACTICTESTTEAPSLRKFESNRTPMFSVTREYLISTDPYFSYAMEALKKLDEIQQILDQEEVPSPTTDDASKTRPIKLRRRSTMSREYWHSDTIPLGKTWNHMKYALVTVDDFTRMSFEYPIKDKSQYSVAAALEHFFHQQPTSNGIKGINFFINRTVLRSDRGTDFINSSVHDLCECLFMLGSIRKVSKRPGRKAYQRNWTNRTMRQGNVKSARFSIILLRAP